MKKIKLALIAVAILAGVGGAAATTCVQCEHFTQYIQEGNVFVPVGEYGTAYFCLDNGGVCTFYNPDPARPNLFAPCRTGTFVATTANTK